MDQILQFVPNNGGQGGVELPNGGSRGRRGRNGSNSPIRAKTLGGQKGAEQRGGEKKKS